MCMRSSLRCDYNCSRTCYSLSVPLKPNETTTGVSASTTTTSDRTKRPTSTPSTLLTVCAFPLRESRDPRPLPPRSIVRPRARPCNLYSPPRQPVTSFATWATCDPATLTRTRAGDGLSILFILNVTCGKHSLDAGLGGARYGDDVTVGVGVYLFPNESGSGFVTDGVKETVDIQRRGLARLEILDGEGLKQITVTLALGRDRLDAGQTVISDHVPSALVGRRGSHSKARSPWDDLSTAWP